MEEKTFLEHVNESIQLNAEEPLYRIAETFCARMQEQYGIEAEKVKAALDFPLLAKRQQEMIREKVEAYVKTHPCDQPLEVYCEPLCNEAITLDIAKELVRQAQAKTAAQAKAPIYEAPAQPPVDETKRPAAHTRPMQESVKELVWDKQAPFIVEEAKKQKLSHSLHVSGKIVFWAGIVFAALQVLGDFGNLLQSMYYYSGYSTYTFTNLITFFLSFVYGAGIVLLGYVGSLVLEALSVLLKRSPQ